MLEERTFKLASVITITILLIIYCLFMPKELSKQRNVITAAKPATVMMLIKSTYPMVRIDNDSLMYSKFGIFIQSHDEVTASYASTQSLEVTTTESRRISRVAWEILVMYSCVLFFFVSVGKATKLDRPPPFLPSALAVIAFIVAFGMAFGIFTFILFGCCFLFFGFILSMESRFSKRVAELEIKFGLEADSILRVKLAILFEVCFLLAAVIALHGWLKPLNFGFEYHGWYFIGTVLVLSIVGFYTAHTFTKRKVISLDDEEITPVFLPGADQNVG